MKNKTKYYWILISVIVVANIGIFSFFSRNLESYVAEGIVETNTAKF